MENQVGGFGSPWTIGVVLPSFQHIRGQITHQTVVGLVWITTARPMRGTRMREQVRSLLSIPFGRTQRSIQGQVRLQSKETLWQLSRRLQECVDWSGNDHLVLEERELQTNLQSGLRLPSHRKMLHENGRNNRRICGYLHAISTKIKKKYAQMVQWYLK